MQRSIYIESIKSTTPIPKFPLLFCRFVLLVACLLNSCIALTQTNSNVQSAKLALNKDSIPLKIAIRENNSPFSIVLPNGKVTGLYADIWKVWSQVTGRPIIFLPGSYLDNIKALKNGEADFHAGLFINKDREKWAFFSMPIDRVQTGLFFHGDVIDTPSLEEMSGKTISVGQGSFQEIFIKKNYPEINLVTVLSAKNAIDRLLNMEIDAIISESAYMNVQLARLGINGALTQREQPVFTNTTHALIPTRNEHLVEIINLGIKQLPLDKIIKLEKKWLPGYPTYFETFSTSFVSSLSMEEQEWLLNNDHFVLGVDPVWRPFEFIDEKGAYSGITSEYVARVAERLSIEMTPAKRLTWAEVIEKVKNGQLDILPGVSPSKEREEYLVFSDSYVNFPTVVVTRSGFKHIQSMNDLSGKLVAVAEGYLIIDLLKNNHPGIEIKLVENISEGLQSVQDKEVFGYIDNLAAITHYTRANQMDEIRVAFITPYEDSISFGIRKGLEPLVPIINKALASISAKERKAITNSWLEVRVNVGTNIITIVSWGLPIFMVLVSIILYVLRSNNRMQMEIKRRTQTEFELEEAKNIAQKANLLKGDFLANMSHEIRTPMNAVMGMTHLLENTKLDPEQKKYIDTLNQSSASLLLLIDDILDLSKIEAGKLALEHLPFNIRDILNNLVQQIQVLSLGPAVKFSVKVNDEIPALLVGDGLRLGQILLNLTGNAAKFTKQGSIGIKVSIDSRSQQQITLHFVVEDTGIGMTDKQIENIFQTYSQADSSTTREYGGTGLGLAICKSLCKLMQGDIWVKSEHDKGSQFHFTCVLECPAVSVDNLEIYSSAVSGEQSHCTNVIDSVLEKLRGRNVLLVDDNLVNLTIAKKMLTNADIRVITALTGQESIDRLNSDVFDCVLMDIQMPEMDGYSTTKVIRTNKRYGDIPIIGLSANVMAKGIIKGREAGMNDYLGKPINRDKLLLVIAEHLLD